MSDATAPQRVLICEDEGLHVMAIRKALVKAGYQVVGEAMDGSRAIQLANELHPDLILMDINMPGDTDGVAAAREILRVNPVPIIMLTAYSDDEAVNAALDAGACAYLVKPITSEQLLPAIRVAMAGFQALQEALHESADMKEALETRKLVERAKGIYMERRGMSEADAFRAIQKMSRDRCQTMKQSAQEIIKASEIL